MCLLTDFTITLRLVLLAAPLILAVSCGGDDTPGNDNLGNDSGTPPPTCSNGVVEGTEECDEGTANSDSVPDACRTDCTLARCGDWVVDSGELCDEGAANSDIVPDACRTSCELPSCGDGVVDIQLGENCDEGADLPTPYCGSDCRVIYCGNGVREGDEVCDDGNVVPGDGCSADCLSNETCGNGILDALHGEQCDDGASNSDTAPDACRTSCHLPRCGDGVVDALEGCDDGAENADTPDEACRTNCQPRRCGDGVIDVQAGEVCDDGNVVSGDGCSGDCRSQELCGNGYLDAVAGEECDDGNAMSHDGCSSGCTVETPVWEPVLLTMTARNHHTMAYDVGRQRIVMFGGWTNLVRISADTWEYDGNRWYPKPLTMDMTARIKTAIAYDGQRMVLFGGYDDAAPLGDTWIFDGVRWTRVSLASQPGARLDHQMVFDSARQRIVLYGGYDGAAVLGDTWAWDGTDWSQLPTAGGPSPRRDAGMAYDAGRDRVVLFGGSNAVNVSNAETWEFDGTSWIQRFPATSPSARSGHTLSYDAGRGVVVLFGGGNAETWEWNGSVWTQKHPTTAPPNTADHAMAYDDRRGVVVVHGGGGSWRTDATWEYDGTEWSRVQNPPKDQMIKRSDYGLVYDRRRRQTMLYGGLNQAYDPNTFHDAWFFGGAAWVDLIASSPSAFHGVGMVYDGPRDRTVMFGGMREGVVYTETWEFDGTSWQNRAPATRPSRRRNAGMVYDARLRRTVLNGGYDDVPPTYFGDTWSWDGAGWTQLFPGSAPPARMGHRMAYDARRGRTVLFGGKTLWVPGTDDMRRETWEFDGARWQVRFPDTVPTARRYHGMAYDARRERVLLFGGAEAGGNLLNDLWEYDGKSWRAVQPSGYVPAPRSGIQLSYDAHRAVFVMFGGSIYGEAFLNETWELSYSSAWPDEVCDNGTDDDGDGRVDCADPDCSFWPPCFGAEQCDNGKDDDNDLLVDCADPDCDGVGVCEAVEASCADGVDNDRDGDADCDDPDCAADPACPVGDGSDSASPGLSCLQILEDGFSTGDGTYFVDPDGGSHRDAFAVYCDMSTDGGGWTLVHKLSRDVPGEVYRLFTGEIPLHEKEPSYLNLQASPDHYLNRIALGFWNGNGATVEEARVGLYDSGVEVAYLQFDAAGMDRLGWFQGARLTASSWTDLGTEPQDVFSIGGQNATERRWLVSRTSGDCATDAGWLVVTGGESCAWEQGRAPHVSILYAPPPGCAIWGAPEVEEADVLAVFVR